mmetsp:Transcript_21175/g.20855  ORF Transcript_21175/g.20855 Transcript_21175/m.20855 type:complete len:303 (-) Transcript_21175:26-934(-)
MMRTLKSHLPLPKRKPIIFNNDYNTWKAKQIEKKKEDTKIEDLDKLSETINPEYLKDSAPSVENSQTDLVPDNSVNLPGVNNMNLGSLSFVGEHAPKFPMANPPSKNTTFELPKQNPQGFNKISGGNQSSMNMPGHMSGYMPGISPPIPGMTPPMSGMMPPMPGMPPPFPRMTPSAPGFSHTKFSEMQGSYPPFSSAPEYQMSYPGTPNGVVELTQASGRLKFFDEVQNYGFLVVDQDHSDLFVHYDDLKSSRISRDILRQAKTSYFLQFTFDIVKYSGKYKESKKAVNLKLVKFEKLGLIN